jgi:ferredoxin, 2Fe-2S
MQSLPLHITDQQGITHHVEGLVGWRLMEVIRDYGLPIKAQCGGACSCATCHVYVDVAQLPHLPAPFAEEIERLDDAFDVQENSRLSCQIILDETMHGLRVTLAAGTEP